MENRNNWEDNCMMVSFLWPDIVNLVHMGMVHKDLHQSQDLLEVLINIRDTIIFSSIIFYFDDLTWYWIATRKCISSKTTLTIANGTVVVDTTY